MEICARVNETLDPGTLCSVVLSSTCAGLGAAGGVPGGTGVAKPYAQGGGASSPWTAVAAPATAVNVKADATNSFFMISPRFLVRPCELPIKKDDDHAISPAWSLERAVNAGRGTSADRLAQSIGLHIFLVAAVAGCPQLPDQPSELNQAFGVASPNYS